MYFFPYLEPSVVLGPVLTVAFWPSYRFLRRHVRWSGIPISWRIFQSVAIYTVKGFGVVNKAEVDVFLGLSCFSCDSMDVGNLISGSSAFSKSRFYIWKFLVHGLLNPSLKDFGHYLASMWNTGLDEAHVGIKIAGRNVNNLRYADDTTLIAESEEELKSILMRV